jgi:hypothetical protein
MKEAANQSQLNLELQQKYSTQEKRTMYSTHVTNPNIILL